MPLSTLRSGIGARTCLDDWMTMGCSSPIASSQPLPAAMTTITCRYDGDLRCTAEHDSGMALATDAPLDNQGKGEAFSPTDLVGTALGTCILTLMGMAAERHHWPLEGASARVEKTMTSSGTRRIDRLEVWVTLPPGLSEQQRVVLQRAAESCPVKHTLEGAVEVVMHWPAQD